MIPILGGPIPLVAHTQTAAPLVPALSVAAVQAAMPVAPVAAAAQSPQLDNTRRRDAQQGRRERRQPDGDEARTSGDADVQALGQVVDTEI